MSLLQARLEEFLDQVGSAAPTPGGGSVAALAGSLAADLGRMAAALTLGKAKFADVQTAVSELAERLGRADAAFRRLIDEDAAAYGELRDALALQKTYTKRAARVAGAAGLAGAVPLETAALARQVEADLARLEMICNPHLRSDVQAGRHLARAAAHSAAANVRANLPLMQAEQAGQIEAELSRLVGRSPD